MFNKTEKLKSTTLYEEDLIDLEKTIKNNMDFNQEDYKSFSVKINLEEQTLEYNNIIEAINDMKEKQINSNAKIQIDALAWKNSEITQSVQIKYYNNFGEIIIRGEEEVWVKGFYTIIQNKLTQIRKNYFSHRFRTLLIIMTHLLIGFLIGYFGFKNLYLYISSNNPLYLLLVLFFTIMGIIISYYVNKQKIFPFVKIFFFSKNEKKDIDSVYTIPLLTLIATIIIGVIQIVIQI